MFAKLLKGIRTQFKLNSGGYLEEKKNKQTNNQEPLKSFQSVTIFFANVKHPATSNYLL